MEALISLAYSVFSILLVVFLIVIFHEFGHFATAKKCGIGVTEFSIGMFEPLLYQKEKNGTKYSIRAIPIGGFVDLVGMDEASAATLEDPQKAFINKPPLARIATLSAGSIMNFVLALLLFWLIYSFFGTSHPSFVTLPVVEDVVKGTPAEAAGFKASDRLIAINGQRVSDWDSFRSKIGASIGKTLEITVGRGTEELIIKIMPVASKYDGRGVIGVVGGHPARLGDVVPGSPAYLAGFRSDDIITKINEQPVQYWHEMEAIWNSSITPRKKLRFTVVRETGEVVLEYSPEFEGISSMGVMMPVSPIIGQVLPGRPAERAGFRTKDRVVEINGTSIQTWHQMLSKIEKSAGKELSVKVVRADGSQALLKVTPEPVGPQKAGKIGITYYEEHQPALGPINAIIPSLVKTWEMLVATTDGLYRFFTGQLAKENISGPVGIAKIVNRSASESFIRLLNLIAILSINIGLLNLLPIPALDGARVLFVIIEMLRGGKKFKSEESIHGIGFMILLGLMLVITYFDIFR